MTTATIDRIIHRIMARSEPPEGCLVCSDCRMLFLPNERDAEPDRSLNLGAVLKQHRREECGGVA